MRALAALLALGLLACSTSEPPSPSNDAGVMDSSVDAPPRSDADVRALTILFFTKTASFRHDAIPHALGALRSACEARGHRVMATEDAAIFAPAALTEIDVVVFLLTTGDVLDTAQQSALEAFVRGGGGFVGVHSASDTEYDWAFYAMMIGAYFRGHPPGTTAAAIDVIEAAHPSVAHLPSRFTHTDEWYSFQTNPRDDANLHVVLALDEASFDLPSEHRMGFHPIAWHRSLDAGRAFYTALGHTREAYDDDRILTHMRAAIEWAAAGDAP